VETEYREGDLSGPWRSWHENGQAEQVGEFTSGKETGKWTTWDWDGKKLEEGNALDGQRQGEWTYWDGEGDVPAGASYNRGQLVDARSASGAKIEGDLSSLGSSLRSCLLAVLVRSRVRRKRAVRAAVEALMTRLGIKKQRRSKKGKLVRLDLHERLTFFQQKEPRPW